MEVITLEDTSRTGMSFLSKRASDNPREMVVSLIEVNPEASKEALFEKFKNELLHNKKYQQAVEWYFFINAYEYAVTTRNRKSNSAKIARANNMARRAEIAQSIKAQIVFLSLVMPNGKVMAECTGSEMATFGEKYIKIAKAVGESRTVGEVLSEQNVRAILSP